jgi:hypothetical protein
MLKKAIPIGFVKRVPAGLDKKGGYRQVSIRRAAICRSGQEGRQPACLDKKGGYPQVRTRGAATRRSGQEGRLPAGLEKKGSYPPFGPKSNIDFLVLFDCLETTPIRRSFAPTEIACLHHLRH